MATVTAVAIKRSGPAIRAALAEYSPGDQERFEAEIVSRTGQCRAELGLEAVHAVLARWHALATMAANPLTDDERAQVARAKTGDFTGLSTQDEHGNWITL
jgi:hypothetical protein